MATKKRPPESHPLLSMAIEAAAEAAKPIHVYKRGSKTIVKSKSGLTIHATEGMSHAGLERFMKSKKFPKRRKKITQKVGEMSVLKTQSFKDMPLGSRFYCKRKPGFAEYYVLCVKIDEMKARVLASNQIFLPLAMSECLSFENVSYSLIIKTSPETANQMATKTATKKAATKKTAVKKGAAKKSAPKGASKSAKKEGPGKIEQILELHKKGLSNKEIEAKGFNYGTISIQVAKYKREHPTKSKK